MSYKKFYSNLDLDNLFTGAFNLITDVVQHKTIRCSYEPRKPGIYVINVLWNNIHVPGSPFQVYLAINGNDLANYQSLQPLQQQHSVQ